MNLLIDSGNSMIKWALANGDLLYRVNKCESNSVAGLHDIWNRYDVPDRVIIANVAGENIAKQINITVNKLWHIDAEFIASSRNCCGLTSSYHNPGQLGVDRWMAMAAAFQSTLDPVIVVDCGTAVTIDLVNENGVFVGGVILPGLNTAYQSLRTGTKAVEGINSISIKKDISPVAKSTEDGVAIGVLLGLVGGIERVIREQSSLIDQVPAVFMTGGDAEKLQPHMKIAVDLQPDLVLQGLRIAAL